MFAAMNIFVQMSPLHLVSYFPRTNFQEGDYLSKGMNKFLILGVELGSEGWGRHLGVEYNVAVLNNFWRASELFRWLRQV